MTDTRVTAPAEILAEIVAAFEDNAVRDLEAFAAARGVTPPDDRDGWTITYEWGPNGEDNGLHWYQPDDEPSHPID